MAHLVLKNITKEYPGNVRALYGFNLEIQDRELVVVVGPSGCGKSTLLRMIAGLEEVTSGGIILNGMVINDLPPRNRNIAMMFQNYVLFPHMTVRENMAFGLRLRKVKREEIRRRVAAVADTLEIQDLLDRFPHALSGGQRQRAALGRAVLRKPEVFLLDEPLSNLDAKMRSQMRTEITRLHKSLHATMVFVTHDQTEAMTMGDRIVILKDGKIQQVADPITLYHHPVNRFVAGFIGSPAMNFLKGAITEEGGTCSFRNPYIDVPLTGEVRSRLGNSTVKELVLGVRPEDIVVSPAGPGSIREGEGLRTATIDIVEHMGPYSCVYFTLGNVTMAATDTSGELFFAEEKIEYRFNEEKIHLFDAGTGRALDKPGATH